MPRIDPATVETIPEGTPPGQPVRHIWMQFTGYARLVGAEIRVGPRECCGCHRIVPITDVFTVMPIDANNTICGPGYLYCGVCRLGESPGHAYAHADTEWKTARHRQPTATPDIQLTDQLRPG